ncbi:MAG: hypothetical protein SOI46_09070 [Eggerthellaceae bacterium]|jgi:hypothetical protein
MYSANLYQQRPVHRANGRPIKSALLHKKLPKFEVSANGEEFLREQETVARDTPEDVERRRALAAPKVGPKSPFEEQVDAVLTCVGSQNSLREILYKILAFCTDERDFAEVEAFALQTPEYRFGHLLQAPYELIHMLIEARGLDGIALDEEGAPLEGEAYEGFTAKDLQHAATTYRVRASAAGEEAAAMLAPARRYRALELQHPHRRDTYRRFMEFCCEPRTLPEIQAFYDAHDELAHDTVQIHHTLAADFYVDKLEKAGMLVWIGAWTLTDEGKEILASFNGRGLEE